MPFTKPTNAVTTDYPQQIGRLIDLAEGPARRNYIRNGDFQIAQRGTSFAGITTAQYCLDGVYHPAAGTQTVSQQAFTVGQTDVPDNPVNFLRVVRSVATGAANVIAQFPIEFPARLSGKTVTLSFRAKVSSGTKALTADILSSGVTPSISEAAQSFNVSTSWALFSFTFTIDAMTAATSSAYLLPRIVESASLGTFTIDIAEVQLEEGSEATRFERLNYEDQLLWNQRFFCKSFQAATAPAQNIGGGTGEHLFPATKAGAAQNYSPRIAFPVRMRASPSSVTLYNPSAANAQVRDSSAPGDGSSSSANNLSETGFHIGCLGNASTVVGNALVVHWAATAEL